MIFTRRTLLAVPGFALPASARAQAWPTRPIRLISTFEPGGAADILARSLAAIMPEELQQTVIVENRTGAAGNLGAEMVARATDNHTIYLASTGPLTYHHVLFRNLAFDPLKDFAPIGLAALSPNILAVRSDRPWRNLQDFIEEARRRPGALTFGSSGIGTTQHLTGELLQAETGIELLHVPYRGGAPAVRELVGGRIDMAVSSGSSAAMIRSGEIRAIAVSGATRIPMIPDVPTMSEQGYPNLVATAWYGLVGPSSMPTEVVMRLDRALRRASSNPAFVSRMRDQTLDVRESNPEEFSSFIAAERGKWAPIAQRFAGTL
ncbi:MAG: transporter substrate-binding protein [Rubritepida sp.]|nr:transporter substrate-binding protein [Rubritepida sp.]